MPVYVVNDLHTREPAFVNPQEQVECVIGIIPFSRNCLNYRSRRDARAWRSIAVNDDVERSAAAAPSGDSGGWHLGAKLLYPRNINGQEHLQNLPLSLSGRPIV